MCLIWALQTVAQNSRRPRNPTADPRSEGDWPAEPPGAARLRIAPRLSLVSGPATRWRANKSAELGLPVARRLVFTVAAWWPGARGDRAWQLAALSAVSYRLGRTLLMKIDGSEELGTGRRKPTGAWRARAARATSGRQPANGDRQPATGWLVANSKQPFRPANSCCVNPNYQPTGLPGSLFSSPPLGLAPPVPARRPTTPPAAEAPRAAQVWPGPLCVAR